MPEMFKLVFNKDKNGFEQKLTNIAKHLPGTKSKYQSITVSSDFVSMRNKC